MSPADTRLYVIGDIHGRLDLLDQLIELINRDIKSREGEAVIVTLGDYVDRGPNTSGVLDRLANNPFEGRYVALKGNHEALLEAFLDNPAAVGPDWWHLGGLETVKSFGSTSQLPVRPRAAAVVTKALPATSTFAALVSMAPPLPLSGALASSFPPT